MGGIPKRFRAFRVHDDAEGYRSGIEEIGLHDLAPGDVVILKRPGAAWHRHVGRLVRFGEQGELECVDANSVGRAWRVVRRSIEDAELLTATVGAVILLWVAGLIKKQ